MAGAEFPVRAVLDDKGIDQLITQLTKTGKAAGMSEKEIKEMNDEIKKTGREGPKEIAKVNQAMGNMANNTLKRVGAAIVAAFAVDRIISMGKEIVKITAEFQKMEAVLTNTLGSRSAARIAMAEIVEFASKTPFAVGELTQSFVKLANQGFIPTQNEMRRLGDLAASTGKSFDQLTEAIIDAQTGEFERLKEFGIRASKQGDQVIFTFKGVKTQVDFTSEAMREYVLALGDIEGVTGAMAAISQTLGGAISNLGDSWETFLRTLGDGQSGPLRNAIKNLTILLSLATEFVKTSEQKLQDVIDEASKSAVQNVKDLTASYGDLKQAGQEYLEFLNLQLEIQYKYNSSLSRLDEANEKKIEDSYEQINILKAQIQAVNDYMVSEDKASKKEIENKAVTLSLIQELEAELKKLKEAKENAFSVEEIARLNFQIELTSRQLKELNEVGTLRRANEDMRKLFNETQRVKKEMLETFSMEDSGVFERFEKGLKKMTDAYKEQSEQFKEIDAQRKSDMEEAQQYSRDTQKAAIQSILDFRVNAVNQELFLSDQQRQKELADAGSNEEAKLAINRKYDQQRAQLMQKQAEREQLAALFNMAINQGPAIAKTLGTLGLPAALPFIAALGTLFAVQIASTRAQAVPRFAKGVFKLKGPGSETSDSIPALLSKNESVVPAKQTQQYSGILQAMIHGSDADVEKAMMLQLRSDVSKGNQSSSHLEDQLRAANKQLEKIANKQEMHININENGFNRWIKKGNWITHFNNRRYSS